MFELQDRYLTTEPNQTTSLQVFSQSRKDLAECLTLFRGNLCAYQISVLHLAGNFNNSLAPAGFNGFTPQNPSLQSFPALLKIDSDGNLIWGTNAEVEASSPLWVIASLGDGVSLSSSYNGITWGNFSFPGVNNKGPDLYHARFNMHTGTIISMDTLASSWGVAEYARAIAADRRGNVYIGGEFQGKIYAGNDTLTNIHSGGVGTDFFLVKSGQANCNGQPITDNR